MTTPARLPRLMMVLLTGLTLSITTGCTLFSPIRFTNVSDDWLNVRFYVGEEDPQSPPPVMMVSKKVHQVGPGASTRFSSSKPRVHIQIEPVTPSWEPVASQYWLELMTRPPVHIVATGRGEKLEFQTGSGEVAIIPQRARTTDRYVYETVTRRTEKHAADTETFAPATAAAD